MRRTLIGFGLALAFLMPLAPSEAQRGPGGSRWEELGRQSVGFGTDTDSITLNQGEEFYREGAFRALRFAAEGNDVNMISIRLVFMNGHTEDIRVDRVIKNGSDLELDLPGERSYLRQIDMQYRSNVGLSFGSGGLRVQQATVTVSGERVRRPPPPPPAVWRELDTQSFSLSDNKIVLNPSRADGRVSKIRLKVGNELVIVKQIDIRFRSGETQTVRVDRFLEAGEETDIIDLDGTTRVVDSVTVDIVPRRRAGRNEIQLAGFVHPPVPGAPLGFAGGSGGGFREIDTQSFSTTDDKVVFRTNRGDGRLGQIRLKVGSEAVIMRGIDIRFRNGEVQKVRIDKRMEPGEQTQAIDLEGEQRVVDTVTLDMEPRRRQFRTEVTLLGTERPGGAPPPSRPAVDPYLSRGYSLLGEQTVAFTADRDVINVAQTEEGNRRRYRTLHIVTENNEVYFNKVRIIYGNGYGEDFNIERAVPAGTDIPIDLKGERAFIKQIEMTYRSRPSFRGQAIVKVYGETVRR